MNVKKAYMIVMEMPRARILREVTFAHAQNTTLAMVLFVKVQYNDYNVIELVGLD
jgi:hypothetical protein